MASDTSGSPRMCEECGGEVRFKDGVAYCAEPSADWLVSQDPSSGYPGAIPLTLSEDELVELQEALGGIHEPLRRKLRAAQMSAFTKAHG